MNRIRIKRNWIEIINEKYLEIIGFWFEMLHRLMKSKLRYSCSQKTLHFILLWVKIIKSFVYSLIDSSKLRSFFLYKFENFLKNFDDGHVESLLFKTLYQKTKISPLQTCLKHKFNQASTKAHWIANWHTTSFISTTPFWKQPTFTKCEKKLCTILERLIIEKNRYRKCNNVALYRCNRNW